MLIEDLTVYLSKIPKTYNQQPTTNNQTIKQPDIAICLAELLFTNYEKKNDNGQRTDNEVHPRRDFVQCVCFDDSDGIRYGVYANRVKGVSDYLVSVFRLVVGEQDGVVSEVLLHEAVDIDAIVMPDGSLDGVVENFLHCRHLR